MGRINLEYGKVQRLGYEGVMLNGVYIGVNNRGNGVFVANIGQRIGKRYAKGLCTLEAGSDTGGCTLVESGAKNGNYIFIPLTMKRDGRYVENAPYRLFGEEEVFMRNLLVKKGLVTKT